jgi:hypothetical protein
MKGVNHLAVVVVVILHQMLGFLWYGVLFLNPWLSGLSKSTSEFNSSDPVPYVLDIAGWFLASYVMAWLIRKTNADSPGKGAVLGFILWLGLAVPALVPHYAFAGLKPIVMVIDSANVLVACLMTGTILAAWQRNDIAPPGNV